VAANTPTIPLTTVGVVPVSDFSRSGDICSRLVEFN
jgi:hypothetical protein